LTTGQTAAYPLSAVVADICVCSPGAAIVIIPVVLQSISVQQQQQQQQAQHCTRGQTARPALRTLFIQQRPALFCTAATHLHADY